MRTVRADQRPVLSFERLEERLPMSASLGSLEPLALPTLEAARRKPIGSSFPVGLTPDQVRTAYGFDSVYFGEIVGDGTGQTIAIVNAYHNPNIVNDLAVFSRTFGLPDPPSFTIVNQNGGAKLPKKNRGWASEIALDVQWAHAIAPGANILLVEAKNPANFGAAIDYARRVPGVSVISVSAAGDEYPSQTFADPLFTTPPGHIGETFVFAAGDDGAGAMYPSSSPNVLSVGGTSLYVSANGDWHSEYAWSGSGGGVSQFEGLPSYQDGLGLTARGTPDVAYNGDPVTGFAVYDSYGSGGWVQFGGTSAGTPQWAALLAIANQGRALAGRESLENAQAVLYAMPSSDFHDIVFGSNGLPAASGYDLATGLGSPIADRLIPDLVAYNGKTDFTVTPLPNVPTTRSNNQSAFYSLNSAAALLDDRAVTPATASLRVFVASSLSVDRVATRSRTPATMVNVSAPSSPTNTSAFVDDQSQSDTDKRNGRRSTQSECQLRASFALDNDALSGIDAYFAAIASSV